jgi:hypothetical protein
VRITRFLLSAWNPENDIDYYLINIIYFIIKQCKEKTYER